MSGIFTIGEKKDRPGIYKRRENIGTTEAVGARAGVGCAVVTGNWGPLNEAHVIDASEDITKYVGTSGTSGYKTVTEMFRGGVQTAVIVRVGTGGTPASVTLKDTDETPANVVTITSKCPGTMDMSITVKANLNDSSLKDVTIYTGTTVLEKFQIAAGNAEVAGIIAALTESEYVTATKVADGNGTLATVTQASLAGGVAPTVTNAQYSEGFEEANTELFDVICVDTTDAGVHALLAAFIERIYQAGDYPMAVISEDHSVSVATRLTNLAGYDDEKMVYVFNGWKDASNVSYEGYMAAARLTGMIAAIASNDSLTHKPVTGATILIDSLTNTQIVNAIKAGGLVISRSKTGQVMIEKAITTRKTVTTEMDAGWKKIRRVKTRNEMMYRIDATLEPFVGAVNNDTDGRAAIMAAGQSVLDAMAGEGKILPGASFALDENNPPSGDSAWFVIKSDDLDSFEIGYVTYQFRFAPED